MSGIGECGQVTWPVCHEMTVGSCRGGLWDSWRGMLRLTMGFWEEEAEVDCGFLEEGTSLSPVMLAMGILFQSWLHCFLLYAEAVSQPEG